MTRLCALAVGFAGAAAASCSAGGDAASSASEPALVIASVGVASTAPPTSASSRASASARPVVSGYDADGIALAGPGVPCVFPDDNPADYPARCSSAERCCVLFPPDHPSDADPPETHRCVGHASDDECPGPDKWDLACDEASDCGKGEVCCGQATLGPLRTWCVAADKCDATLVCLPGSAECPKSFHCERRWASYAHSLRCVWDGPKSVACGGEKCSGKTPICQWDLASTSPRSPTSGRTQCVASRSSDENARAFECSSRADCGGTQICCGSPHGSACSGSCATYFPGPETFCASDRECKKGERCVAEGELPPGFRVCKTG